MSLLTAGFSDYPERWNQSIRCSWHDRVLARTVLRLLPNAVRPNHLTVLRLMLIIPVAGLLAYHYYYAGLGLFLVAALTDALDGSLARSRRQISDWGVIFDPLADKLLIVTVIAVVALQHINLYLGLAILLMEAIMIICGWLRVRRGRIEPANFWGKAKMVFEVIGLSLLLLAVALNFNLLVDISIGTLALALVLAIASVRVRWP
jgi:CDP-diacylglycerol--glycerol-3-phosphate 3-phosphatidyltransferase